MRQVASGRYFKFSNLEIPLSLFIPLVSIEFPPKAAGTTFAGSPTRFPSESSPFLMRIFLARMVLPAPRGLQKLFFLQIPACFSPSPPPPMIVGSSPQTPRGVLLHPGAGPAPFLRLPFCLFTSSSSRGASRPPRAALQAQSLSCGVRVSFFPFGIPLPLRGTPAVEALRGHAILYLFALFT